MVDLLILDFSGVLVNEMLAFEITKKCRTEGMKYFKQYKTGEISATELAETVVKIHRGLSRQQIESEAEQLEIVDGAVKFVDAIRGRYEIVVISSDYSEIVKPVCEALGIEKVFANEALYYNDIHTGHFKNSIIADKEKAELALKLKEEYNADRIVCVGDDNTNIEMFKIADLSIAYNATPELKEVSDLTVDGKITDLLVYLLNF